MKFLEKFLVFLYCVSLALSALLIFSGMLDVFCYLSFGGWDEILGNWPILRGTVSAFLKDSPFASLLLLTISGLIAREIVGKGIFKSSQ